MQGNLSRAGGASPRASPRPSPTTLDASGGPPKHPPGPESQLQGKTWPLQKRGTPRKSMR
eukprot:2423225-Pyramimonas_sp.AAC.1